jgi:hypothetical protein
MNGYSSLRHVSGVNSELESQLQQQQQLTGFVVDVGNSALLLRT